jgi:TrmH family RNA methyltransferase
MTVISSRDNPRVRRWRDLTRDAGVRRDLQRAMIEGEHLVSACLQSGRRIEALVLGKSASTRPEFLKIAKNAGVSPTILADPVFKAISEAGSPTGIAAEIAIPPVTQDLKTAQACVFLEAIQDAGNVGTIMRSAAAFGIRHAVLGQGCADAWSPKVLRAGMGAHFAMAIRERADLDAAMESFGGRVACTVPRGGVSLADADLSGRIGWLLGAEGRGVSEALAARAKLKVTIPMPVGAESLNVAAAAAICFYQFSKRGARA